MLKRFVRSSHDKVAPAASNTPQDNVAQFLIPKRRKLVDFVIGGDGPEDDVDSAEVQAEPSDYLTLRELAPAAIFSIQQNHFDTSHATHPDKRVAHMLSKSAFLHFQVSYQHGDSFGIANRAATDENDLLHKAPLVATGAYLYVPPLLHADNPPFVAGFGTQDVSKRSITRVNAVLGAFMESSEGSVAEEVSAIS